LASRDSAVCCHAGLEPIGGASGKPRASGPRKVEHNPAFANSTHPPMTTLLRRILLCSFLAAAAGVTATPALAQSTMVRVQTTMGAIDMALVPDAPVTVANFLAYSRAGDFTDVFFHRNAWLNTTMPFVIQTGEFRWTAANAIEVVTSRGAIVNEFSTARSNVRGTVAMAKVPGIQSSATSQWFINMGDNAANLDTQNGGFTVFARVTAPGMSTADRISALPDVNADGDLSQLPVVGWTQGSTTVQRNNVVRITAVRELPTQTGSDRVFNYLEANYPQYVGTTAPVAGEALGYVYRFYPDTQTYVGTKDGAVWYQVPAIDAGIHSLGALTDWLGTAQAAGY
jgi:peptidyl-prolyl cis-trans isomerase A (cyclophilin A)